MAVEFHLSTPIPEWGGTTWYSRFEENAQQAAAGVTWLIPLSLLFTRDKSLM